MLFLWFRPHLNALPSLWGWVLLPLMNPLTDLSSLGPVWTVDCGYWFTLINSLPHFGDSSVDSIRY